VILKKGAQLSLLKALRKDASKEEGYYLS